MQPLERIKISGFKSIREMDLKLNMLNVLVGANGAGKSNFIGVFKLVNQIIEGRLQSFVAKSGGADALLHFGQKVTSHLNIWLIFGLDVCVFRLTPSAKGTLFLENEGFYTFKSETQLDNLNKAKGVSYTGLEESTLSYFQYFITLPNWRIYHFHDTGETATVKQIHDLADNERLRSDAANLAAFLYLLREKHHEHYRQIVNVVRLVAPFFDDFNLRPSPLNPDKIMLEWREKDSDAYFNAHSLSDGTLRFICLATLLLQPAAMRPSTLLIDEPELGLHPYAINLLAGMLQSAATKTQVIVSTQSVPLINKFAPEDLLIVDREDGQSVFKRLDSAALEVWLEEYSLGELWEKNLIGGRP
jgi:predicted ATPase